MSDYGSENDSHYGQNDNISDLNDTRMNIVQTMGAIRIPSTTERDVFHVTGTMLQLLQLRGMFCGFNS